MKLRSGPAACSDTNWPAGVAEWLPANMAAQDELSKFLSALLPINISWNVTIAAVKSVLDDEAVLFRWWACFRSNYKASFS